MDVTVIGEGTPNGNPTSEKPYHYNKKVEKEKGKKRVDETPFP